jgi:sulfur-carrier protein adenylyltransferase/sulfurtransferase
VFLLDVRTPEEYQKEHIPGAKLIPIDELNKRTDELDPAQPTLVYCAIGGRSRVGAQILAGKGFSTVYNLSGGIKAWNGWTGFGDYEQGLHLFDAVVEPAEALELAYAMEVALQTFYEGLAALESEPQAKQTYERLASFELGHKKVLATQYQRLTGGTLSPDNLENLGKAVEGGVSTQEYMDRMGVDPKSAEEIVSFAMAIEAQAMDLYSRAAEQAAGDLAETFTTLSGQEKDHLRQLGRFMSNLVKG